MKSQLLQVSSSQCYWFEAYSISPPPTLGQPLNFHAGATDMSAQAVDTRRKPL